MRTLTGATDRPLGVSRQVSRSWNGFRGYVVDVTGGVAAPEVFETHYVCMLASVQAPTACHCDGRTTRRMQVAGDFDFISVGHEAAWEDGFAATFVAAKLDAALVRTAGDAMGLDADRLSISPRVHLRDPLVEHLCWALKGELETAAPFGRLYAESLGLALAAQLVRGYAEVVRRCDARGLSPRRLQRVTDYITANVALDLTLADLAAVAGVSPSHLTVLFKRSTGLPVHQYVLQKRVEQAVALVRRDEYPLCDVALLAGFANQSHMARAMRRFAGVTPRELRRAST